MISTEKGSWLERLIKEYEALYRTYLSFNDFIKDQYTVYLESAYARAGENKENKRLVLKAISLYRTGDREEIRNFFEETEMDYKLLKSPAEFYFASLLEDISSFDKKFGYRNEDIVRALSLGLADVMEKQYKAHCPKNDEFPDYDADTVPTRYICEEIKRMIASGNPEELKTPDNPIEIRLLSIHQKYAA